jgi:Na+-translocating ferredoxin:NAD+ oxidoreductase RnfC subunit
MRRYELASYAKKMDLTIIPVEAGKVRIPTQQGSGSPALPLVKEGDRVQEAQLIGEIPEGKLGARMHASIAGKVTYAGPDAVEIQG